MASRTTVIGPLSMGFRWKLRVGKQWDSDASFGCRPMYPECVAFLRKTMRVREIVKLAHLSHSDGFAQKRNTFRIHGTTPFDRISLFTL